MSVASSVIDPVLRLKYPKKQEIIGQNGGQTKLGKSRLVNDWVKMLQTQIKYSML